MWKGFDMTQVCLSCLGDKEPSCCVHDEPFVRGTQEPGGNIPCLVQSLCLELVWRLVNWGSLSSWFWVHQQIGSWEEQCKYLIFVFANKCVLKHSLISMHSLYLPLYSTLLLFYCDASFLILLTQYKPPDFMPKVFENLPMNPTYRDAIVNAMVYVHQTLHHANLRLSKRGSRTMAITPRHYLDFINHYVSLVFHSSADLQCLVACDDKETGGLRYSVKKVSFLINCIGILIATTVVDIQ